MAPKEKNVKEKNVRRSGVSFKWDDTTTTLLLCVCQEFQKKHGHGSAMGWAEIVKDFKEKSGQDVTWKTARNKFEWVKKMWRTWNEMKNNETGLGWDPKLNVVDADDFWWDRKCKENPEYKKFRGGISVEKTDLWTDVFGGIVATGRRCVAPTMDVSSIPRIEGGDGARDTDTQFDCEQNSEDDASDAEQSPIDVEATPVTLIDGCEITFDSPIDTQNAFGSDEHLLNGKIVPARAQPSSSKRKGRAKPSSQTSYNQHLSDMNDARTRLFRHLDDDSSSGSKEGRKVYDLDDAMVVIEEMVEKDVFAEGGEMWCVAMSEVEHEESRQLFMRLKSDFARTKWLEYRLSNKRA